MIKNDESVNRFFLIALAPKRADYEPEKRNASHLVEMDDVVEKELYMQLANSCFLNT